jgi:arylsulfatase A-like enzyme
MSDRRSFLATLGAVSAGVLLPPLPLQARRAPVRRRKRPNIVMISADDLGYGDLGCFGRADYLTPVLDGFASQGMRFTHAYSAAPVCTPTRVGFMTGRYPARHPVGLREPLTGSDEDRGLGLEVAHPTLSSLLKGAGYTNALFGKWHLGLRPEFHPNRHGFDEFFGPLSGAVDHLAHTAPWGAPDLWENERPVRVEGYLQDLVVDRAVAFLKKRPEPFFLSLQGTAPHWPWQGRADPPRPVGSNYQNGPADRYPEMVRIMDEGVGRVLVALEEAGLADGTLVIFTSDNGGERYSSMGGLAGHKGQTWEGGIRVPAMARWPGVIPPGTVSAQALTTLDWTATILAAAETAAAASHPLDGIDLLPALTTPQAATRPRSLFWRMGQRGPQGGARIGTWKYHVDEQGEGLFDLVLDPGERQDVSAANARTLEEARTAYTGWTQQMLPSVPLAAEPESH